MSTKCPIVNRRSARIATGVRVCLVLLLVTLINALTSPTDATERAVRPFPEDYAGLVETARANGTIRVIVGVKTSSRPEGLLADATSAEIQRAGIAQAQQTLLQRLQGRNPRVLQTYEYVPFMALNVDTATMEALAADPEISSIQVDEKQAPALFDNVSFIGGDAQGAFSGFTGAGQTVAVLDSGVDSAHPFLQGKVVSEACYSTPNTENGETSLCPNGDSSQVGTGAARPGCAFQVCDHGTHVAGIVAGNQMTVDFTDYGMQTLSGVAKGASIIAIQVFERDPGDRISTYPSDQIKALERVYALRDQFKIAAVNMSLGGQRYTSQEECDSSNPSIKAVIDQLRSVGIATIVSSGNAGYTDAMSSPACISSAISVGSVGYDASSEWIAESSNRAAWLSLYAPGVDIVSAGFGDQPDGTTGEIWAAKSGTSQAAPHVAGAWAVLREKAPNATIGEILTALQSTGKSIADDASPFIKPRIQVAAAVDQLVGGTCPTSLGLDRGASTTQPHASCKKTVWLPVVLKP